MLPPTIPLFPLPNVVLFPERVPAAAHLRGALPGHGDRRARRGPDHRDGAAPARLGERLRGPARHLSSRLRRTHHARRTAAGRPLQHRAAGAGEVPVLDEDDSRAYRLARVDSIDEQPANGDDKDEMRLARRRLEALLVPQPKGRGSDTKVPPSMADEDLVNALAQYLELEPVEKQALLERDSLLARCRSLIELLEMKVIVAQHKWGGEH